MGEPPGRLLADLFRTPVGVLLPQHADDQISREPPHTESDLKTLGRSLGPKDNGHLIAHGLETDGLDADGLGLDGTWAHMAGRAPRAGGDEKHRIVAPLFSWQRRLAPERPRRSVQNAMSSCGAGRANRCSAELLCKVRLTWLLQGRLSWLTWLYVAHKDLRAKK